MQVFRLFVLLAMNALLVRGQAAQCDWSLGLRDFHTIEQPIEHSDPDQGKYTQRYTQIHEYYKLGGPLLFYAGPENAATQYELLCLNLSPMAKQLGGYVVGPEHRFFGSSIPSNTSFRSMTIENTLADYAQLIQVFKSKLGQDTKVVVFGGSYGGFLSAMMRVWYPHLVQGSIASAAPIFTWDTDIIQNQELQPRWFDKLGQILQTQDLQCAHQVQRGFRVVGDMLQAGAGQRAELAKLLSLCHTPDSSYTQRYEVLYYMKKAVQVVTQFNFPFKGATKVGFAFNSTCDRFKLASDNQTLIGAVSHLLDLGKNNSGKLTCHAFDGTPGVNSAVGVGDINFALAWYYMSCTEFILPVAGGNSFFGFSQPFDFAGFSKYCDQRFNSTVKPFTAAPVHAVMAGNVSNIIFSNQGFDPTQAFSLNSTVPSKVGGDPAMFLFLPGGAHTIDIIYPQSGDSQDVNDGRQVELEAVKRWTS